MSIRPAREEDLDRVIEIHTCAYPDGRSYEQRRRSLTHHSLADLGDLRVVEEEGKIVAHGIIFLARTFIGGGQMDIGAITAIAVAPEARGRGVATALIGSLHAELSERGATFALLHPFSEGFYTRLGYASTAPSVVLRVAAQSLADRFELASDHSSVVGLNPSRLSQMQRLYDQEARNRAGHLRRAERRWHDLFRDEQRHFLGLVAGDALSGYVAFHHDATLPHARTVLAVDELIADGPVAARSLLAALGRQKDQVDDVELTVAIDDPLLFGSLAAPGSRWRLPTAQLGVLAAGPMVRLVDVRRALLSRRYLADGELTIRWTDDADAGAVHLSVSGGAATLADPKAPAIEIRRDALGSVIAAGLHPRQAVALGLAKCDDARAIDVADALFAGPRFLCLDPF
jgi:predicted acetyltransferase